MDMNGFLGKKVDIKLKDGKNVEGYVFDILEEDDSDSGRKSVDIALLDSERIMEIEIDDIEDVKKDGRYKEFDFRK